MQWRCFLNKIICNNLRLREVVEWLSTVFFFFFGSVGMTHYSCWKQKTEASTILYNSSRFIFCFISYDASKFKIYQRKIAEISKYKYAVERIKVKKWQWEVTTISSISQPTRCKEGHSSSIKCAAVAPPWKLEGSSCTSV